MLSSTKAVLVVAIVAASSAVSGAAVVVVPASSNNSELHAILPAANGDETVTASTVPDINAQAALDLPTSTRMPYITTINGHVPPLKPTSAKAQTMSLEYEDDKGWKRITHLTRRAPGTRSPIHTHDFGGQTCIIEGEMTLYLEGAQPVTKKAGECYWMPPGPPMSGVNTATTDTLMFDIFYVPITEDVWTPLEPFEKLL